MDVLLNKFTPRPYQLPLYNAVLRDGYKRALLCGPRRMGKDLLFWSTCILVGLQKKCLIFYCLPTYSQAKKCIWDAVSASSGMTFLDYIPRELVESTNQADMKIKLKNGSVIQLIGADSYNSSLVGTSPYLIAFSEFALCDPQAYKFALPILAENNGICLICSTPRGHNFFYELYTQNKDNPEWFVQKLTVDDTKHISKEALEREKQNMPLELFEQEYFCSFDRGLEGSIYGRYVDAARREGRICDVPWDPNLLTYVALDIGISKGNDTALIFFQTANNGSVMRIIDAYSNTDLGLDHYVKVIQDKKYKYGNPGFYAPADLRVREWGNGGVTRWERANQLGINMYVLPQIPLQDGIDLVYTTFGRMWFDQTKCRGLISALENYRRQYDSVRQVHSAKPLHTQASNLCDALRYGCMALPHTQQGMSGDEFTRIRNQMMRGQQQDVPRFFDDRYDRLR